MHHAQMEGSQSQDPNYVPNPSILHSSSNESFSNEKQSSMKNMEDKTYFIFDDLTNFNPPPRIRTRVDTECKKRSLNEIETRLKEAKIRRQKFLEWLANKAKNRLRKRNVMPLNDDTEERVMRIEAKLSAAELKREERAEELRQKRAQLELVRKEVRANAEQMREQKEKLCGSALEVRVAQAEANREAVYEARSKRRASLHCWADHILANRERASRLYDERLSRRRDTILKKLDAANAKRAARLAAESVRARAVTTQARQVAERVWKERQAKLQLQLQCLERKIELARRRREEILQNRILLRRCGHFYRHRDCAENLSHKLSRCWRHFLKVQSTTYSLTQNFLNRGISLSASENLPFEELSKRITSPETLRTIRLLLSRIHKKLVLSSHQSSTIPPLEETSSGLSGSSNRLSHSERDLGVVIPNIDNLLRRVIPSKSSIDKRLNSRPRNTSGNDHVEKGNQQSRTMNESNAPKGQATSSKNSNQLSESKLSRYPERIFLCAYMIKFHPDAVFSENGKRENDLSSASIALLQSFENLLSCIVTRRGKVKEKRRIIRIEDVKAFDMGGKDLKENESLNVTEDQDDSKSFVSRLREFDSYWVNYLHCFVAWKVRDEAQLENELIAMACNFEKSKISILNSSAAHPKDKEAICLQVEKDQKILSERIFGLTGVSGREKLENKLKEIRASHEMKIDDAALIDSQAKDKNDDGSFTAKDVDASSLNNMLIEDNNPIKAENVGDERINVQAKGGKTLVHEKVVKEKENEKSNDKNVSSQREDALKNHDSSEKNQKITETSNLSEKEYQNCILLNEIFYGSAFKISSDKSNEEEFNRQLDDNSEHWTRLQSDLLKDPMDSTSVVQLIQDIFLEISRLKRERNARKDLEEYLNSDYLKHIFQNEDLDFGDLRKILDYFIHAIMALDSLEKEKKIKVDYEILLQEIQVDVTQFLAEKDKMDSDPTALKMQGKKIFSNSILKALKFVYKRLQTLKKDIGLFRINLLSSTIRGDNGVSYLRSSFSKKFSLSPFVENLFSGNLMHAVVAETPAELKIKLPKTSAWINRTSTDITAWIKESLESAISASATSPSPSSHSMEESLGKDLKTPATEDFKQKEEKANEEMKGKESEERGFLQMKAGRRVIPTKSDHFFVSEKNSALHTGVLNPQNPQDWRSLEVMLIVGFLNFTKMTQGVTDTSMIETFWLDLRRIRSFQENFQRLIVTATSLLIVSQVLALKSSSSQQLPFDPKKYSPKILSLLGDSKVSMERIAESMADVARDALKQSTSNGPSENDPIDQASPSNSLSPDESSMRAMMCRMLFKALSPNDVVFLRVNKAVYMAMTILCLLGRSPKVTVMAENELKKIGATYLMPQIHEICDQVREIMHVHSKIYSPWYVVLLR